MKVVIAANSAWNIANFRTGLIRRFLADGHTAVAVAPPDAGVKALREVGCRVISVPMDNQGSSPWNDLALLARYLRIMRAERPDVYLGYTVKPNVYGTLAARAIGIPVINNVSGLGTAFIRETWLTGVVKRLYRLAFRKSSTIFFQNADDRDLFVAERMVRADQARVIPGSGIDLDQFASVAMPKREAPVFLLIARLLWDKGIGEYVAAARSLRECIPEARCRILGFLDVPNRTAVGRSDIDAWIGEGIVEYLGFTDDVRPFIADADCVVLPSYREGTPRTLLEAAALGRPLIATDVPGCREPVREGVNGYLVKARDAVDLARAMMAFAALSAEKRAAMGRESRLLAEARYDEAIVINAYLEAIAKATGTETRPLRPTASARQAEA